MAVVCDIKVSYCTVNMASLAYYTLDLVGFYMVEWEEWLENQ